jgi:hypothetical protein
MRSIFILIAALAIISLAAAKEYSSDEQNDLYSAISMGLKMGELKQQALSGQNVEEYNSKVVAYQDALVAIFGSNQTAIKALWLDKITPGQAIVGGNATRPHIVHKIDASFDKYSNVKTDAQGLVKGYPADAAYTAMGSNDSPPAAAGSSDPLGSV